MESREFAYADWISGMKYKDIAEKYGVSLSAIKSWATRDWKLREVATGGRKELQPENKKLQPEKRFRPAPNSVDKQLADAVEENEELTQQQKDFCLYYTRIRNATQAYFKAYGCLYSTAHSCGPALLAKPRIKKELHRLREIKIAALGELCGEDIVELHMRIAFADITDFVEFKGEDVPVMHKGEPVTVEHPETGERIPLVRTVNEVKLRDSHMIDGQIINEVSEGRDGAKIKLADRQKSLDFLERYFKLNPMDQHRIEYENRKLALDEQKENGATAGSDVVNDWIAALLPAGETDE